MGNIFSVFNNKKIKNKNKNKNDNDNDNKNNNDNDNEDLEEDEDKTNYYFKHIEVPSYSETENSEIENLEYYKPLALYPKKPYLANEFILR